MYWIPAIFLFCEMVFFTKIPSVLKMIAFNEFIKNLKTDREKEIKENPTLWTNTKYPSLPKEKQPYALAIYFLSMMVYFIVALFYPIWWFAVIIFSMTPINLILSKILNTNKENFFLDIDSINSELLTTKLERKIKIENIDGNFKTKKTILLTKEYIFSLIRIAIYISIIVMNQYGMFIN